MLVFRGLRDPLAKFEVLSTSEFSDQPGVCAVTFVASEFPACEGLDAARVDDVEASESEGRERLGDGLGVVPRLLQAGDSFAGIGNIAEPCDELDQAGLGVVEAFGVGITKMDDMAEEVSFSDIDAEKEGWIVGRVGCSFHGLVQSPKGRSKQLAAEKSQSHQNRFSLI